MSPWKIYAVPIRSCGKVKAAVDALSEYGPTLGRPLVDFAKASSIANLKELRPRQTTIRVLFVFGPWRSAILLSAGDEASQWKVWYERAIRKPGNCTRSN